jgi:type I restriction enzyme, S subunit
VTLPTGWQWVSLEELIGDEAPIVYGIIQAGPEIANGIPYVRPTELEDGRIDISSLKRTSTTIAEKYSRSTLKAGDIVLAIVGTIGKLAIVPPELEGANITQSSARLRPPSYMPPSYLAAVLRSPQLREQFDQMEFGVAVRRLNIAHVRALRVPLAPANEQRRIVAKLDAIFEQTRAAKARLQRLAALLDKLKRSILAAAFRGDLTADWRAAHPDMEPASAVLDRIRGERRARWESALRTKGKGRSSATYVEPQVPVEVPLSDIASTWCWAPLELLRADDSPMVYGIILPGDDVPDGVRYVRPIDMADGGIIEVGALKRAAPEIAAKYARSSLRPGDLILSIVGTIGKVAIVPEELDGGNITQSSIRIRAGSNLAPEYAYWLLQSPQLTSQFDRYRFGIGVQRLNVEHVRQLVVPFPSLAEQREIAKRVSDAMSFLKSIDVDRLSGRLADMERAALAKAFRGKLVEQDPNDEPAAALLKRLQALSVQAEHGETVPARRSQRRSAKGRARSTARASETIEG